MGRTVSWTCDAFEKTGTHAQFWWGSLLESGHLYRKERQAGSTEMLVIVRGCEEFSVAELGWRVAVLSERFIVTCTVTSNYAALLHNAMCWVSVWRRQWTAEYVVCVCVFCARSRRTGHTVATARTVVAVYCSSIYCVGHSQRTRAFPALSIYKWILWNLRSSGILRSVEWQSLTDVSGQPVPWMIGCPETSMRNCHSALRDIPEERRSHPHRDGSLKSRNEFCFKVHRSC